VCVYNPLFLSEEHWSLIHTFISTVVCCFISLFYCYFLMLKENSFVRLLDISLIDVLVRIQLNQPECF
jgi:hypothetical protein